ncbi:MAG: dimethylsulfonioproprionate lyase family protein [Pseudomonadota bacterium]
MTGLAEAQSYLSASRALLMAAGGPGARMAEDLPEAPSGEDQPPISQPVARVMGELADLAWPPARALMAALAQDDRLTWRQTYRAEDFGPDFLQNYGWVEFLGPFGPCPSSTHRLALLVLGPGTHYPEHSHGPEEVYLVLAGEMRWTRGTHPPERAPGGALLHHPPHLPHAMETDAHPVAMLGLWQGGNLAAKSDIPRSSR